MKGEVISFRADIPPGTTNKVLRERIKDQGQLIEVRVRFYPGQERALQVRPYVQLLNQQSEDIFTYASGLNGDTVTEHFLSGDDDYFTYPVMVDLRMNDYAAVMVTNTDSNYTYTVVVDMVVQYFGAPNYTQAPGVGM